jgi:cold-inducible RNA-binding protein
VNKVELTLLSAALVTFPVQLISTAQTQLECQGFSLLDHVNLGELGSFGASVYPTGGKGKEKMSMKLYVGNLAFETTSNDLQTLFAQAGTVESVALIEDRETGRSRGFGFVEMQTREEGAAAVAQFNGKEVAGRTLKVNEAKPRENRNGGGRY